MDMDMIRYNERQSIGTFSYHGAPALMGIAICMQRLMNTVLGEMTDSRAKDVMSLRALTAQLI
jgi:hypothetical protein